VSLTGSFEALVAEHDRIGSPLREELLPGSSRGRVEDAVRILGLDPPPELIDFFAWHDLAARPGSPGRIDWFWPAGGLRLTEAIDEYRRTIELGGVSPTEIGSSLGSDQPPSATFTGFWRTDWFPVLGGSPETYAIECPGSGGSTPGAIWRVNWHPSSNFQTASVASSLTEFVDRIVDLFRLGAYRWDARYEAIVTVDEVFDRLGLGASGRPWP
jgi:hypothetical protein